MVYVCAMGVMDDMFSVRIVEVFRHVDVVCLCLVCIL